MKVQDLGLKFSKEVKILVSKELDEKLQTTVALVDENLDDLATRIKKIRSDKLDRNEAELI